MKQLISIVATIALSASLSMAQTATVHTQAEIDAHRAKIDQAIVAKDYAAWKAEHLAWNPNDTRVATKVNESNFATYAAMREAQKAGDYAKAQQLRTELGIEAKGQGQGQGKMGQGKGKKQGAGQGKMRKGQQK